MANGPGTEIPVHATADGRQLEQMFNQVEARLKQIERLMAGVGITAEGSAKRFKNEITMALRDFNRAQSQVDQFDRSLKRQSDAISRDELAANRLADEKRRLRERARKNDDADARARLAEIDREERAVNRLETDKRKLRGAARREERQAEADRLRGMDRDERAANRLADEKRKLRRQARREEQRDSDARLRETDRDERAANRLADEKRKLRAAARKQDDAAAQARLGQIELEERAANRLAAEQRKLRAADRRVAGTDANPDRALRTSALRAELKTISDIGIVEARRDASAARINQLLAQRSTLTGQERRDINKLISEEIRRNGIIDQRINKLRADEIAARRRQEREDNPPGVFGGAGGMLGIFARTAAYGGAASVIYGLIGAFRQGVGFAIEFEDKLKQLQAIASATDTQMVGLGRSIIDVGVNSRYSLTQLTDIAIKLAQAGVSAGQMKEALQSVSQLATASGSSLEEAGDLVTASLGAFQLQGSETARVADLMTAALNRTRLTVQQAALAVQYVGATAFEQNITLEQLLATSAALSQAGIRSGSTIGTGMRQFLVDLQRPSEKLSQQFERLGISLADVDVTTRGLPAVLETLNQRGFGAAQAYGSLETRAAAFYLVAKNNVPLMNELQMLMAEQGVAAMAAERAMDSLSAQWQRFSNIVGAGVAEASAGILNTTKNLLRTLSDQLEEMRRLANEREGRRLRGEADPSVNLTTGQQISRSVVQSVVSGSQTAEMRSSVSLIMLMGQAFEYLGRSGQDTTGNLERFETALAQANERSTEARTKYDALTREIQRLTTQSGTLAREKRLVQAETVTLMGRFEGLAQHIVGATDDIHGLIGALRALREQEGQTLEQVLTGEIAANANAGLNARTDRDNLWRQIHNNSALMGQLRPNEVTALNGLNGDDAAANARILGEAADRIGQSNRDLAKTLNDLVEAQGRIAGSAGRERVLRLELGSTRWRNSAFGGDIANALEGVDGLVTQLRSSTGDARTSLVQRITQQLDAVERDLKTRQSENPTWAPWARQGFATSLSTVESLRAQTRDITTPSTRADRAADTQAQMIQFSDPVRNASRRVTSGVGRRNAPQTPNGRGSTDHQGVDIGGSLGEAVYAAADGYVKFAAVRGGYGNLIELDHGGGTLTRYGHLSEMLVARGDRVNRGQLIGKMGATGRATGNHLHFEREVGGKIDRNPLSGQAPGNINDIEQGALREQEREADRARRNSRATAGMATQTAERDLRSKIRDLRYALTEETLEAGMEAAGESFDDWANAMREQARIELEQRDATPAEVQAHMQEVTERIEQRREELQQTFFEAFLRNFERGLQDLQDQFERSMRPGQNRVSFLQAQLEGLSRPSLNGRVPDYVQQLAERRVGRAQEEFAVQRRQALPGHLANMEQRLLDGSMKLATDFSMTSGQREELRQQLDRLSDSVGNLRVEYNELLAQEQAASLVPQTMGQHIQQAIEAYREAHNLTASWNEMISMNLTTGIQSAHQAIEGLLTDLASGTKTVEQSFRDMAMNIISALQQVIVKMIAVKLMELALSAFGGGASPTPNSWFGSFAPGTAPGPMGMFRGGEVKGAYRGEYIRDGVPNRDSTLRKLAKGEFVTQKSAVDSVGVDFMESVNARGAAALKSMAPKIVLPPQAKQSMSVFVVAPDHKPQMGPNDVLVTIAEDIVNGGQTKKLIQYVTQGG